MDELYKIQNVTYNATGGTLKNNKAVIDLTAQQNRLLRYLVLNAGQTLTKEQITAHVWGYDVDSDVSNLIYDTVSAVRRLLKKAGLNGAVTTKTGIGYAFTDGFYPKASGRAFCAHTPKKATAERCMTAKVQANCSSA